MNPLALLLLIVGVGCFIGGAMTGVFNGASLLGLLFTLASLFVQVVWPRDPIIQPETHPGALSDADVRDGVGTRNLDADMRALLEAGRATGRSDEDIARDLARRPPPERI